METNNEVRSDKIHPTIDVLNYIEDASVEAELFGNATFGPREIAEYRDVFDRIRETHPDLSDSVLVRTMSVPGGTIAFQSRRRQELEATRTEEIIQVEGADVFGGGGWRQDVYWIGPQQRVYHQRSSGKNTYRREYEAYRHPAARRQTSWRIVYSNFPWTPQWMSSTDHIPLSGAQFHKELRGLIIGGQTVSSAPHAQVLLRALRNWRIVDRLEDVHIETLANIWAHLDGHLQKLDDVLPDELLKILEALDSLTAPGQPELREILYWDLRTHVSAGKPLPERKPNDIIGTYGGMMFRWTPETFLHHVDRQGSLLTDYSNYRNLIEGFMRFPDSVFRHYTHLAGITIHAWLPGLEYRHANGEKDAPPLALTLLKLQHLSEFSRASEARLLAMKLSDVVYMIELLAATFGQSSTAVAKVMLELPPQNPTPGQEVFYQHLQKYTAHVSAQKE